MTETKSNNTLNFVIIRNQGQAQKVLDTLKEEDFEVSQCAFCKAKIVNRTIERGPQSMVERWLAKWFKITFHMWDCNLGNPIWKTKKVCCNELPCFISGHSEDL